MIWAVSSWAVTLISVLIVVFGLVSASRYSFRHPEKAFTKPRDIGAMVVGLSVGVLIGGMIVGSLWITLS